MVISESIKKAVTTKFVGLQTDNHMNWMNHIEEITYRLSGAFYVIRLTVHISNINNEINLLNIILFYYNIGNNFEGGGATLPTVGRFSLYKRKLSELWMVHNPEPHVLVYLKNYIFYFFHSSIYFH